MIKILINIISLSFLTGQTGDIAVDKIIAKMDKNLNAKSRILTSKMVVYGRRTSRTIESKSWVIGTDKSFTEYLSPAREAGTKMLKLGNKLWTYSPQTDRVIQISGHMLRQSVMGSDMSYNDMMEDRPLEEIYEATISGSETFLHLHQDNLKLVSLINEVKNFNNRDKVKVKIMSENFYVFDEKGNLIFSPFKYK